MSPNEVFTDIVSFWERIAPYIFAHIIAALTLRFAVGLRLDVAMRAEHLIQSARYARWRKLFDEFELRPKLPFLMIIAALFYFAIFQKMVGLISKIPLAPINLTYRESDFWREGRPFYDVAELAALQNNPEEAQIWILIEFQRASLEEMRAKFPDSYKSFAGWRREQFNRWFNYYHLSLLFAVFCVALIVREIRAGTSARRSRIIRLTVVTIATIAIAALCRYRSEQSLEHQLREELRFTVAHLKVTRPLDTRLSSEERAVVESRLFREFLEERPFQHFWFSRILESCCGVPRAFPRVSREEFSKQWGYKLMPQENRDPVPARGGDAQGNDLQGSWLPSAAELAGIPYPDEVRKTIKLVVQDDRYMVTVGQTVDKGTTRLNPAADPKELDIIGTEGPNKGKTILAIYERDGDTLRVCYDLSGAGRPTEFKTKEGSQLFLVTYEREKR